MQISITMSLLAFFYVVGFFIAVIGVFHEEYKDVSFWKKAVICIGWPLFILAAIIYLLKDAIERSLNDK